MSETPKMWLPPWRGGLGGHDDWQPWQHQRAHHQPGRRFWHRVEAQGIIEVFGIHGFLADNAHFCRNRSGMHGKGTVLRHFSLTHCLDDHVECLTDISAQTQGSATFSCF